MPKLHTVVATCIALESLFFFYTALSFTYMAWRAHAPLLWLLEAAWPPWLNGCFLFTAACLYAWVRRSRIPLSVIAVVGALLSASNYLSMRHIVVSYRAAFKGDLVAIGALSLLGLVLIGILAVADQLSGIWVVINAKDDAS